MKMRWLLKFWKIWKVKGKKSVSIYVWEIIDEWLINVGTEVDPKAEDPYKKAYASALRRAVPTTFKQKQNLYDDGYEDDEDADDAGEDVYGLGVDDDVATNPRRSSDTPKPRARDDDDDGAFLFVL